LVTKGKAENFLALMQGKNLAFLRVLEWQQE
jgi:hypothetical protein